MLPHRRLILLLSLALAVQSLVLLIAYVAQLGPEGRFGGDFIAFWEAAQRLGAGQPLYDAAAWHRQVASGKAVQFTWFVYPPFAALGLTPLAGLAYGPAVLLWSVVPSCLYFVLVFRLARSVGLPPPAAWALVALSSPLLLANLLSGQTGTIMACLLLAAALHWDRRPWLAGVFIGLCAIKPQLGLLLPFVLVAGGRWQTFAAAAITVAVLLVSATLIFGLAIWSEHLAISRLFASVVAWDYRTFDQLALGPYLSLRVIGVPVIAAIWVQALLIGAVLLTVIRLFARTSAVPLDHRLGVLAAGALLVTPYALLYDLPLTVLALLAVVRRTWEEGLDVPLVAPVLLLLLSPSVAPLTGDRAFPVAFVALLATFGTLAWRSTLHPQPRLSPAPPLG